MNSVVLDTSAVLAFAHDEPGADVISEARASAVLSAVNHAEVVSKLLQKALPAAEITQSLNEAFPQVLPFDREQAEWAGRLHAATRSHHLSYADCACLALAHARNLPVLTGDRKWLTVPVGIEIRVFR